MLKLVRALHTIKQFFASAEEIFMKKEDIDVFFDWEGVELWEEVDELLLDAIVGYTPIVGKDLSKKTEQFERR